METAWTRLRVWVEGPVGRIVLNRPEVLNALDHDTVVELEEAVRGLARETRVIVLQGAGPHFCAGADLKYVAAYRTDPVAMRRFIEQINRAAFAIEEAEVPVVAAVQGYALAGGFELMQACDIVLVAEDALVGDQHANYGLLPGAGGSQRLPRLVGRQRALALLLTGEWLSGREAAAWGLAYRAVPADRLEAEALALARRLASRSRCGLALMKRLVRHGAAMGVADAIRLEVETFLRYIAEEDPAEGLRAFAERRAPRFA